MLHSIFPPRKSIRAWTFLILGALAQPAAADVLTVTVTNNQPSGGFAVTPLWVGLHNGGFTTFTPGAAASADLRAVAELGNTAPITAAFTGQGPQATIGGGPVIPGGSAMTMLNVADPSTTRYLSYLSMIVPSNDFFIGNANPLGIALFDAGGQFLGPRTIQIFGRNAWDAGTEVNDVNNGPAFVVGQNATAGAAEGGVVTPVFGGPTDPTAYLNSIAGVNTPAGYSISHLFTADDLIATITIQAVPEPATLPFVATVLVGAFVAARRRWFNV